jgi:hypothetical protein
MCCPELYPLTSWLSAFPPHQRFSHFLGSTALAHDASCINSTAGASYDGVNICVTSHCWPESSPVTEANFAWLNRFGLSLLKQLPGRDSIVGKRRGCDWSETFLLEVLTGATS